MDIAIVGSYVMTDIERGITVWGARTLSSDPDLRYVNVSRTMMFLYEAIRRGMMWAVFQPNSEAVLAV